MEKFDFGRADAKVYIPQGGKDYAIVCAEGQNEMPLNFKAAKDGTYTLSFTLENLELDYLHLIDNLTGADVDLLTPIPETLIAGEDPQSTPSYTFTAKTTDYASRFRLVFTANPNCGDAIGDNAPFAYISNRARGGFERRFGRRFGKRLYSWDADGRVCVAAGWRRHDSDTENRSGILTAGHDPLSLPRYLATTIQSFGIRK